MKLIKLTHVNSPVFRCITLGAKREPGRLVRYVRVDGGRCLSLPGVCYISARR